MKEYSILFHESGLCIRMWLIGDIEAKCEKLLSERLLLQRTERMYYKHQKLLCKYIIQHQKVWHSLFHLYFVEDIHHNQKQLTRILQ